jgi:hypothetical protein
VPGLIDGAQAELHVVRDMSSVTVVTWPTSIMLVVTPLPSCSAFAGRRTPLGENPYAHDTRAEDLESCEEALQGCLIWKRALQEGLDRLQ